VVPLIPCARRREAVGRYFAPGMQVIAHRVHHRLLVPALTAKMWIVPSVKDVKESVPFDNRSGEDVEILFIGRAAGQGLSMVLKGHKVGCTQVIPGRAFAMGGRIAKILEIE